MSRNFLDAVLQFIEKHPVLFTLLGVILGSILTLVGVFFRQIGRSIARLIKWMWMGIRGRGKDHHFEQSYLDWLIREHRHLGLLPAQQVVRRWQDRSILTNLEQIFVRLSITTQSGDEHWAETYGHGESSWRRRSWIGLRFTRYLARLVLPSTLVQRLPVFTEQTYQPGDLGLIVDRQKRLVIRGDPGSGKTTLLRYLALTCARARRKNKHDGDSPDLVKKRLLWTQCPFPILVTLRRHGSVALWGEEKELTDTILQEMPSALSKQCPSGFFERYLQRGNCLVLLDAFDELGTPEARVAMARKIVGFLEIYKRDDNRIVVTTRIVGYEGQLDRYDFAVRTVQNLKAGETRALVKQRYVAIAEAESASSDQELRDIRYKMGERADRLIEKIETTPRLAQLAINPMLLSLIVLVHSVKIELPEERLLLYRDCVEILAERWQQLKREEAGIKQEGREELGLTQKLVLLYELAFAMQQQRKDKVSPALIAKAVARDLLAHKLPDLLGGTLPADEHAKEEVCRRKAEAWLSDIQQESGILVEQGLDDTGESLIGFSHLTFQEYLAAEAIHADKPRRLPLLRQNMLQPTWQEVVLLYAAVTDDPTLIMNVLLQSSVQPQGVLLAGSCLTERLGKVKAPVQQMILERLKEAFIHADDETVHDVGNVMGLLGGSEITTFMRQYLNDPSLKKQLAAVKALGHTRMDTPELEEVRTDLLHLMEISRKTTITVAVRQALAQVGDPRFTGPEPMLVPVSQQPEHMPALMRTWKDVKTSTEWKTAKNFGRRLNMLARVGDYWFFTKWYALRRYQQQNHAFKIGKYPITNIEYHRFVEESGYPSPRYWKEGTFPREEATHPVVGITRLSSEAYCKWLSNQTREKYRLPTEWEWEWAAAGPQGWKYPWGDQFEKDRCNTEESGIEGTTPVGSYATDKSFCGASDMSGNVWEITSGGLIVEFLTSPLPEISITRVSLLLIILIVTLLITVIVTTVVLETTVTIGTTVTTVVTTAVTTVVIAALVTITALGVLGVGGGIEGAVALKERGAGMEGVLRGGAWNTSSDKATCFFRNNTNYTRLTGFRCVKEVDPTSSQ